MTYVEIEKKPKIKFVWNKGDWIWIVIALSFMLCAYAYRDAVLSYNDVVVNSCDYCKSCLVWDETPQYQVLESNETEFKIKGFDTAG